MMGRTSRDLEMSEAKGHELVIPGHGSQAVVSVALASGMWPFLGALGFLMHPLVGILMWGVGFALSWTAFRERKESVIRWRSDDTQLRVTVGGGPEPRDPTRAMDCTA